MAAKKQNSFLLVLAGFLVVALGIMAYVVYNQKPLVEKVTDEQTKMYIDQSDSTETDSIEKDLMDTSFDDIDKELKDIETELNTVN